MNTTASSTAVLSWLLTYALHSTALLTLARIITSRRISATSRDVIWKSALVGGILTASVQQAMDLRPVGSVALPATASVPTAQPASAADFGDKKNELVAPPVQSAEKPLEVGTSTTVSTSAPSRLSMPEGLVFGWAIVAIVLAAAYGARRLILVGRLGDRRAVTGGPLIPMLAALQDDRRLKAVHLTSSNAISSPVALGLNEICIPEAAITDLDEDQQRGLLAHELAHLVRRDPVWLDAISVLERVFFFQPLNRMARREMQMAAEHLCDDWAAQRLGSGVPLAKCLAQVAEWIQASPLGVPVAGMAEQRSQLVERIARLVDRTTRAKPASRAVVTVGALALLAGMVAAAPGVQQGSLDDKTMAALEDQQSTGSSNTSFDATDSQGRGPNPSPSPSGSPSSAPSGSPGGGAPHSFGPGQGREQGEAEQDPAIITALIERLKDTDASVRRAAASSLGNLKGTRAVLPLVAVLDDKDKEVRMAAVHALGNIQDPRAIEHLMDKIKDPSVSVRQAILEALSNFDHEEELPAGPIITAASDANAEVRHKAVHLLGRIRDRSATAALTKAISDPSPDVRSSAIDALSEIKENATASINAIMPALKDENADVRHQAVHALNNLHAMVPEKTLLELVEDKSADVRQATLELIRERPFAGAVTVLIRLLDDVNGDVRVEAVSALGEIRDAAARRALQQALSSKDAKVRARAAEVLGERP